MLKSKVILLLTLGTAYLAVGGVRLLAKRILIGTIDLVVGPPKKEEKHRG